MAHAAATPSEFAQGRSVPYTKSDPLTAHGKGSLRVEESGTKLSMGIACLHYRRRTQHAMLRNYLVIAIRNFSKHRLYSFLNVLGLAVGLASAFLIALFIFDELGYDRYHEHADRVYRVAREWVDESDAATLRLARISAPIAQALEREFPEVEKAVQIWGNGGLISYEGRPFDEPQLYFADEDVFEVLTVPLVRGDPASALTEPFTVILTEEKARMLFGDDDPLGNVVQLDAEYDLRVTGVIGEIPGRSHLDFDLLVSMATLHGVFPEEAFASWRGNNSFATYVRLAEGADPEALEAKLPAYLDRRYEEEQGLTSRLFLQPIADIRLRSDLDTEFGETGTLAYVYLFSGIALLVLLIASFNFMNLATARAAKRSREVGVRKVLGAGRQQLAAQFLGEALVTVFAAMVVGFALAAALLPVFNDVANKDIVLLTPENAGVLLVFLGVAVVVGLLSGSYPAAYLSGFAPSHALKEGIGRRRSGLYKGLLVFQFAAAFVLAAGVGVVLKQLDYIQSRPLGFDVRDVVVLSSTDEISDRFGEIRQQLLTHPGIESVTESRLIPSNALLDQIDARAEVSGSARRVKGLSLLPVDHAFAVTYDIDVVAGRDFTVGMPTDSTGAFLLNEAAVREIGWASPEEAIDRPLTLEGTTLSRSGRVVGVLRDVHFESLHERISPMVFLIMPERHRFVSVKLAEGSRTAALAFLQERWTEYMPNFPFRHFFVEAAVDDLYADERRMGSVLGYFAALAVLVACLGLFGLAAYAATERTKEIGIRKVLGATLADIVGLLSRDFARLVAIALLAAAPLTYLAAERWLDSFAYKTDVGPVLLIGVALLLFLVALATVGWQAGRAALAKPVESLRYE